MRILKKLLDPRVAILVFILYLVAYFIYLDEEGGFGNGFFNFGPSSNSTFMQISINTWPKVIVLYLISFFTALMTGYYETALSSNFMEKLMDPDLKVPYNDRTVFGIVSIDKVIGLFLEILSILIITSQQFQFMLPALVADLMIGVVDASFLLGQKS
jgi:hypothetical protein